MSTLNTKYIQSLRDNLHAFALTRRDVIATSDLVLHHAKRSIFALHRGNEEEALAKLRSAEELLASISKKSAGDRMQREGAYRAALEEYAEASLFFQFVTTGSIGKIDRIDCDPESYLSGLCDVPGELYRYAIVAATRREYDLVRRCATAANDIVGELLEFDLTSYLRTKFDQAKSAAQKLEQVVYDVSLRLE